MLKLVKAHFHKDKAVLAAFLLILIVATMLFQTGRMVARFDPMYDGKMESRGISDSMYFAYGDREEIEDKVDQMDMVESFYLVDLVFPEDVTAKINDCKEKTLEDIFFVDDREENLVYPKELGWTTYLFDGDNKRLIDAIELFLQS